MSTDNRRTADTHGRQKTSRLVLAQGSFQTDLLFVNVSGHDCISLFDDLVRSLDVDV